MCGYGVGLGGYAEWGFKHRGFEAQRGRECERGPEWFFNTEREHKMNEELTEKIIAAAIEVHTTLGGPGLLECIYEEALCYELRKMGFLVDRQLERPVMYKGIKLEHLLRLDLLVEKTVVVECKAIAQRNPLFAAQCLTYLRQLNLHTGLVLNFGLKYLKDGIERVAN